MSISFELSSAGQSTATISLNGHVIRHLAQAGRAAEAGINQMVWDMKDDSGRSVSGGTYQLQIVAQTDDGELTRSIVPLIVTR
jgi:flagellar hook assembly protein FlgD